MTHDFTYMGTKRQLAGQLAAIISNAPEGPLLDAFAGMSAVGAAVGQERPIWCNDIQHFAYNVAQSYFTARNRPTLSSDAINGCRAMFEKNEKSLRCSYESLVAQETLAHESGDLDQLISLSDHLIERSQSQKVVSTRSSYFLNRERHPYCLFSMTYAGGYIGLRQAIELDSLRFAIANLAERGAVNTDTSRWMLVALCRALGRVSNSTGHFAQYLAIKEHTKNRFLNKRRKSIWSEWQKALDRMRPLGTKEWRRSNRVFRSESVNLIKRLSRSKLHPAVVYCDPPYTRDHYSRYYHLMETLLLYDYPSVESKGQYRKDRFYSQFSTKTQVEQSFRDLIWATSQMNATLVLSYPDYGLLSNPRDNLVRQLKEEYSNVEIVGELAHEHSTLGASNGVESASVKELVFLASA